MAEDSDAGSVGPPVVNPVAQTLVTMTNEVNASVSGQLFVLLGFEFSPHIGSFSLNRLMMLMPSPG